MNNKNNNTASNVCGNKNYKNIDSNENNNEMEKCKMACVGET